MTWWTWEGLKDVVRGLELPRGEYVLGASGARVARGSALGADDVELLVTERGWAELEERGWPWLTEALHHPDVEGLRATRQAPRGSYRKRLPQLIAQAEWLDGVPVVAEAHLKEEDSSWLAALREHTAGGLLFGLLMALAIPYGLLLYNAGLSAGWQHLTFQTTEVTATVTDSVIVGEFCGDSDRSPEERIERRLTLTWTHDGADHQAERTECGTELETDDETSAWVTSDGDVASLTYGPWVAHLIGWSVVLFIAVLAAIGIGIGSLRRRHRA